MWHDLAVLLAQILAFLRFRLLQNSTDLIIGKARVGTDHCLEKAVAADFAAGADTHFTHHGQPIHMGIQGTQAVGQVHRQHGHHMLGKIHRVATLAGLLIQGITGVHIMGNVRNGHGQLPATAALLLAIHGVVKILGVFAVDGHKRLFAQVETVLVIALLQAGAKPLGGVLHLLWPYMGNIMVADGHIDFHSRRHMITNDFHNTTLRLPPVTGRLGDLHQHELAVFGL